MQRVRDRFAALARATIFTRPFSATTRQVGALLVGTVMLGIAGCGEANPPTAPLATPRVLAPHATTSASIVIQLSVGARSACALKIDNTITCWGDFSATVPLPNLYTYVSVGDSHACAIKVGGSIVCWGDNTFDQKNAPTTGTFSQLAAGGAHTCAIATDATITCWGFDAHGETEPPSGTFTSLDAGGTHTCAIAPNGTLACWGENNTGQTSAPSDQFMQVSGGAGHTCGIRTDATLKCWGWNDDGQTSSPSGTYIWVSGGRHHSCAVNAAFAIVCWGEDTFGQSSPPAGTFTQVGAGWEHSCGLNTDGHVVCWGDNFKGQINVPPDVAGPQPSTTTLASAPNPSTFGQSVAFTATVTATTGGAAASGGTVNFIEGGTCAAPTTTLAASVALNTSGKAAFSIATLAVGSHTVVACYSGSDGFLTSEGSTVQVVNAATTTTTLVMVPHSQQYSDRVTFNATVTPTQVNGSTVSGSVQFKLNGSNAGAPVTLGAGGTASLANFQVTLGQGTYTTEAVLTSTNAAFTGSTGTASLTVTLEDATVVYDGANPTSLPVSTPGGMLNASALSLNIGVKELEPDVAIAPGGTGIGDIANAGLAVTLMPVGPGTTYALTCTPTGVSGSGYAAVRGFTCKNPTAIAVNVYEVDVSVTGNFYVGDYEDVLTIFDHSLGFVTGGGSFIVNGDRVRFGINAKYKKKKGDSATGDLFVVRTHDGTTWSLTSKSLGDLAVGDDGTIGWAALAGKATYTTWNGGSRKYGTSSTEDFVFYVEDHGSPGNGNDRVWIGGPPALSLPGTLATARDNAVTTTGGNVTVPHQ